MKTTDRLKYTYFLGLLFLLLTIGTSLRAQLPSPPNPPRLVNDYTGTLSTSQINTLEHKLVAYNDSTSTQFLVLLVDDLQGYNIDQYASKIGQSWGVGQKGKNNGAVIVVKPKKGNSKGQVTIQTGYGIEEYVTDATGKRIIEKEMIPAFQKDDYYQGIDNAVNVMMDLCSGKFTQDDYVSDNDFPLGLVILVIIAVIIIFSKSSRNNGQNYSGRGAHTIWIPMGGGFGSGGFGGGSSSGGFGGFGGGSFGGGGASGSW